MLILLRSIIFNVLFYANTVFWLIVALPTFLMPYWGIVEIAKAWGRVNLVLLRWVVGIRIEVRGAEKIPKGGLIVAAKHQSAWETFVLVTVQMARGAAALCAGRHVDAVAHLRRLFTAGDPAYHWTMRWWALADLVEAAVRAHQRELVEPLITKFEPLAARTPAFWLRAVLRHARALLAEDRDAEARGRRTVVAGRPDEVMLSRDQAVATRRGTPSCTTGTAVCARRTPSVRPSI